MATAARTNLIIPVPAAEPAVGGYRARLDPTAAEGVPAHISVLVPFLDLEEIGGEDWHELKALFASAQPIEFALARVAWFPRVLYLAPQPAEPFVRLTEAVWQRWPQRPPYGGAFADIVPHLTVAEGEDLAWLEHELAPRLPISAVAEEVWVIADITPGRWSRERSFSLGGTGDT